jgi:hypothetical protein
MAYRCNFTHGLFTPFDEIVEFKKITGRISAHRKFSKYDDIRMVQFRLFNAPDYP